MSNITVLYSGTPREVAAVQFATTVATGLGVGAQCRFVATVRSILDAEQWRDYQMVVGLEGFTVARPMLEQEYREQLTERVATAETAFKMLPEARAMTWGSSIDLERTREPDLAGLGYAHDLMVAGFDTDPVVSDLLIKRILLDGGGPIALVKDPPSTTLAGATVILAWKPGAAAKRAMQSALPILRAVRRVCVVSIAETGEPPIAPDAHEIVDYLRNGHHVNAEALALRAADSPQLQLTELYREIGAALLVMGGFSHSWLEELLFGGFTKYFIANRCCNLLLAH